MQAQRKGTLLVAGQFVLLILGCAIPRQVSFGEATDLVLANVGTVLAVFGMVMVATALLRLGPALTANPVPRERGELVTAGWYRWMRHPVYTGLILSLTGVALGAGLIPQIFVVAALAALLFYKSIFEEQLLLEKYPDYLAYQQKTGRFLPRFGRQGK
jgi:protein-S-isoprenylcysteine O-methyltransferase Ste14